MLPLQDREDAPAPVMLVGVREQARPVEGVTREVSPTSPLKPCCAVRVIMDVAA